MVQGQIEIQSFLISKTRLLTATTQLQFLLDERILIRRLEASKYKVVKECIFFTTLIIAVNRRMDEHSVI